MMKSQMKLIAVVLLAFVSGCYYRPSIEEIEQGYGPASRLPAEQCRVCPFRTAFDQKTRRSTTTSSAPKSYGKIKTFYGTAKSPPLIEWQNVFQEVEFLEKFAENLDAKFKVNIPFTVATKECGKNAAYYSRTTPKELVFCYELIMDIADRAQNKYPPEEAGHMADGAFNFIVTHEMSHALIDVLRLTFTGREEEVADQISATILLDSKHPEWFIHGPIWYFDTEEDVSKEALADEHLLEGQRMYNLKCWAYGRDSVKFYEFREELGNRKDLCEREYRQMYVAIVELLSPYMR